MRKSMDECLKDVEARDVGLGVLEAQLLELQLQVEDERARVKCMRADISRAARDGQFDCEVTEGWVAQPGLYVLLEWVGYWTNCGREDGRYCLFGSPTEAMVWAKATYGVAGFEADRFSVQRVTLPAPPARAWLDP